MMMNIKLMMMPMMMVIRMVTMKMTITMIMKLIVMMIITMIIMLICIETRNDDEHEPDKAAQKHEAAQRKYWKWERIRTRQ